MAQNHLVSDGPFVCNKSVENSLRCNECIAFSIFSVNIVLLLQSGGSGIFCREIIPRNSKVGVELDQVGPVISCSPALTENGQEFVDLQPGVFKSKSAFFIMANACGMVKEHLLENATKCCVTEEQDPLFWMPLPAIMTSFRSSPYSRRPLGRRRTRPRGRGYDRRTTRTPSTRNATRARASPFCPAAAVLSCGARRRSFRRPASYTSYGQAKEEGWVVTAHFGVPLANAANPADTGANGYGAASAIILGLVLSSPLPPGWWSIPLRLVKLTPSPFWRSA